MGQSSPRFRRDLAASTMEVDGVTFVDVSDVATGATFRLYDFEYQLALQLNGQPAADIVAWAGEAYGMELTPEGIFEFAGRLGELGFLEAEGGPEAEPSGPGLPGDGEAQGDGGLPAGAVAAPAQVTNSAEVEWLSLQNAKTTTFVPDAAMLENAAKGVTPPPTFEARTGTTPPPRFNPPASPSAGGRRAPTPSGVTELPDEIVTELADSGPTASPSLPALGTLSGAVAAPNGTVSGPASGPSGPVSSRLGPPVRGGTERRMPPLPDGVVATPFQDEFSRSRFTAPPPQRARRRSPAFVIFLLVALGAGGAGIYRWRQLHPSEPPPIKVRVVSPKPTAVYRWFSNGGTVTDAGARPLTFENGGRVAEIASAGKTFAAGDVLGKLQGASTLEAELAKQRSRLAAARQVRDSMKSAGKQSELRKAEARLAERQKAFDDLQASLNKVVLRATEPGQVTEATVKVGATVPGKTAALKWKGKLLHGDFTLDETDFAQAAALDFCRVEVVATAPAPDTGAGTAKGTGGASGAPAGAAAAAPAAPAGGGAAPSPSEPAPRYIDCQLPPPAPAPTARSGSLLRKFLVSLPPGAGVAPGQALRLARLRYDAVFALPLSAIVHGEGGGDKVWVASPLGVAQLRPVTIAESRDEALVSGGLAIGEDVVITPPDDLREGARVTPE